MTYMGSAQQQQWLTNHTKFLREAARLVGLYPLFGLCPLERVFARDSGVSKIRDLPESSCQLGTDLYIYIFSARR